MVITVSFLGIILVICIVIFLLNKRRLIAVFYPHDHSILSQSEGHIRLLTYNVAGLPEKISSAKTKRYDSMLLIGEKINNYDIVNVQEDFNYNIQLYTNTLHSFKSAHRGKAIWGDGLNTLSKYPILEFRRVAWKKCNGSDCLTPKGFSLARICIAANVIIDTYNVHATSGYSLSAAKARRNNLLQLANYIDQHSVGNALIVMGDFNAHYQYHLDNMIDFLEQTKLQDSWVSTILQGKYPSVQDNFVILDDLSCNNYIETIDKILYRSNEHITLEPLKYKVEEEIFLDNNEAHLSDHLAVMVDLKWNIT
ncbi:endonuclease/exonuclease/phosphatase family protein [Sphingobacterium rhinopitheci]|uniref:endonuclease/exonuclease/phosphatase family protein n=1 Tax=Sphingobacterium rhinopitheci TaxID=2781960 RepID=UPI001F523710|nr:endonuclease/exonuclease/phosphatase family protein [Sphingobacterium rhinopitheci]MCI0920122.1 endonuclease/exonuclease/phosphatase family protein [Sphingobacterium rhinopitheci]